MATNYEMWDRIIPGGVARRMTNDRAAGLSHEAIARQLVIEFTLTISSATVRRWCIELGLEGDEVAS